MDNESVGIDLYVDAADLDAMRQFGSNDMVKGFTTNPTLMRNAGVENYLDFARDAAKIAEPLPLSLEVFADDEAAIYSQAMEISRISDNVFVKIPITTTNGRPLSKTMARLARQGAKVNATAILTLDQVREVSDALTDGNEAIISVFAGRIADTGRSPVPIMREASKLVHRKRGHKLLWASPREILNLVQARESATDIITMTPDLWMKVDLLGRELEEVSLDTVRMFFNDAKAAGYTI